MALRVVTAPTETLVSLDDAKAHLSVFHSDDDALITSLISVATGRLEEACQRRFLTTVMAWGLADFGGCELCLPLAPVALNGIGSISYVDINGASQTLSSTAYVVYQEGQETCIRPAFGTIFPIVGFNAPEGVTIRFTVGTALAAVDATVIHACKVLLAHLYQNREGSTEALAPSGLPWTVENLISGQRWN